MAYNPQMEQLNALQLLTQRIAGQYGGGNDPKSVNTQNQAAVEGMRAQGMTDAQIAQALPSLPWNNQTRAIPAQMPMAAPEQAAPVAPQMPVQAPMAAPEQAPAQAPSSFFQRMGQRFDQAATGGIIDPATLTKDQRRMLRAQLLMNVGGALAQNRPVGEGFQAQYGALAKRQADEEARAEKERAAAREALRQQILSQVDMTSREGIMGAIPMLSQAGLQDDAFKFVDYANKAFPNSVQVMSDASGTLVIDKERIRNPDGTFNPAAVMKIPGTGKADAPAKPAAEPAVQETRVIKGKVYVRIKGVWYEK